MLYTERTRRYTDRRSSGALRPPFYSDLLWYSKKRVGSTVIDEITKNDATPNNGELIFDPSTEIIDLSKYTDRGSAVIGSLEYETITFTVVGGTVLYHIIDNAEKLDNVRNGLSSNYILDSNIEFSVSDFEVGGDFYNDGKGWNPIKTFTGVFNGNGFKISNLFINRTISDVGLFGTISGGTISNIGIVDCDVTGGTYVGGLVGRNATSSYIINCYSTNCTVTGNFYAGGLVGYNYPSSTITNCYSTNCTVTGDKYVGGFLGANQSSSTITNCYYIGIRPIATDTVYLSLFCGRNVSSTITNSYACEIDGDGNDVVEPLQFTGTTTGVTGSGNKTTAEMKTQTTYAGWDFTNIWGIDATVNNGYPHLRNLQAGYTNWLSNYKIVSLPPANVDGYIVLPVIPGAGELSIFDRDNPTLYTDDARNSLDYLGVGYGLYWRIDKLNTANILSWMQPDYKFSWFVKNTFTKGTFDPITIKEIMAYNAPITGASNLSKMMKYLNLPEGV